MADIKTNISVRIIGENIDFRKILKHLPDGAKINRKGEILYKHYIVENDNIIYDFDIDKMDFINQLEYVLNAFESYKTYLEEFSKTFDIVLRVYIQSDMAQMYSHIPKEFLMRIAELSMSLEYSIWSEGMCI